MQLEDWGSVVCVGVWLLNSSSRKTPSQHLKHFTISTLTRWQGDIIVETHIADAKHDPWLLKSSKYSAPPLHIYSLPCSPCFNHIRSVCLLLFFPFYQVSTLLFNGCLNESKTPGRRSSSTMELLDWGRKLQSCNNNVPLNILNTIYF